MKSKTEAQISPARHVKREANGGPHFDPSLRERERVTIQVVDILLRFRGCERKSDIKLRGGFVEFARVLDYQCKLKL